MTNSLETLLGKWPDPVPRAADSTPIELRLYALYRQDIAAFSSDDLRFMIGQGRGLEILVPIALDLIESDPLLEVGYYAGDLLSVVLQVPDRYWANNGALKQKLLGILFDNLEVIGNSLDPRLEADRSLHQQITNFCWPR